MWTRLETHLGSREVAKVVYGSIIGLALVVALEKPPPRPAAMAVWLLGTALAVALAEVFSEVVGAETTTRRPVTRSQARHITEDAVAVGAGVAAPTVFFLSAALGLIEVGTAFTIAKWSGLGLIGCYGYWAARFAGEPPRRALVKGALVALVGAGLIALKALVH